jgi:transposase
MNISLTPEEIKALQIRHKKERDSRVADRIKAVVLFAQGWSQVQIAQALMIRPETVHDHLDDFLKNQKLKPANGGSLSLLNVQQTQEIVHHLETYTYMKVSDICAHVSSSYGVEFTVSGMTKWLHRQEFSYKMPKKIPKKVDLEEQEKFIAEYREFVKNFSKDQPFEFCDAVHPTMATKVSYGWIRKGQNKLIETTGSRTRMNLLGSINLMTMSVTIGAYDTIDSQAMEDHFRKLRFKYPKATKVHLFLDRGGYNISKETRESAEKYSIVLHHLPPYSPNLNPIERLWKVMNQYVRNNRYFKSAKEFREAIMNFFEKTWHDIALSKVYLINDNFQSFKQASSS